MTLLREDLQGADPRLVAGRLELVSGWLHSDVSIRAATSEKDKQVAAQASAAREVALKDVEAAQDRCRVLEAELKTRCSERAEEARGRKAEEEKMKAREDAMKGRDAELEQLAKAQATEHSRPEKLEQKVEAEKAKLDAKEKVLAEDRAAFELLEERSRKALWSLYEKGLEEPLATANEATSEKDKQVAAQASAAREVALKDVEAAQDRCRVLEAELKTRCSERAEEARGRKAEEEKMKAREDAMKGRDAELEQLAKAQATEHSRPEKLEQKVEAEKAKLDAKEKVLAEDRAAFELLEERSRKALWSLYEKGLEEPLATANEGPDGAQVAAAMPTFGERGLVPPAPPGVPTATAPVVVSSGDSRREGEEEEDEERDSEGTPEGMGDTSPLHKADILRTLRDDDDEADVPPEGEEPLVAGGSSRSKANPQRRPPAEPGAASGPSAAPSSAPGTRVPAPQAARLSGFKPKKWRDYAAVHQPNPAAKKRKEDEVVLLETRSHPLTATLSMDKGNDGARASPA
nr:actin cytoskeleton-regulatory complex protein PAN1-like [Aegilops tauschii subsp. strangulata]